MVVSAIVVKAFYILVFLFCLALYGAASEKKHYIIYMGRHEHPNSDSVIAANHDMLASIIGSLEEARDATIHHYTKTFRGFSAMLTPNEAKQLSDEYSVISIFESKNYVLHTTRSWKFLGLGFTNNDHNNQISMDSQSDVIVGVIDSGIWPESRSFTDDGLGPVPTKFKGQCTAGESFIYFNCNRKLIGAKFYLKGVEADKKSLENVTNGQLPYFRSPRDAEGHGTHVASTIAGSLVANSTIPGIATGNARGGAPGVRLAIYKVCWFGNCNSADVLAAIDDAIHDGVDIISASFGPGPPEDDFMSNVMAIGSFHAFQKGILFSAAGGNSQTPGSVTNGSPWIFTVAASTLDKEYSSYVYLGNSTILKGYGLNPTDMKGYHDVILGSAAAAPGVPSTNASFCNNNTLDAALITGKIVVCNVESVKDDDRRLKAYSVRINGGVGMILIDPSAKDSSYQFRLASTFILPSESDKLYAYLAKEKNPVATIKKSSEKISIKPAPVMASFSSKGPSTISHGIIKPDITAPGVNILAAWSPVGISGTAGKSQDFNIISGTSMSTPHVTAIAALVKSVNPSWSPAAIKSAMMTSASVLDNTESLVGGSFDGAKATPFDYGSGHVHPIASLGPGLVYDYDYKDIIDFLCGIGFTAPQLTNFTREPTYCKSPPTPSYNFNYPSIGVSNMNGSMSVQRTVTYYGNGYTVYYPLLEYITGVKVNVMPEELRFYKAGEKMSYRVNFTPYETTNGSFVFGAITWTNGIHNVRSPIGVSVLSV